MVHVVCRAWFLSAGDIAVNKTKQSKSLAFQGLEVETVQGVLEVGVAGAGGVLVSEGELGLYKDLGFGSEQHGESLGDCQR